MRGYQKKIVCLKNTGSSVFEEAYFVIKEDREENKKDFSKKRDFIKEANRIIEENTDFYFYKRKREKIFKNAIIFGVGFLSASLMLLFVLLVK